jgi:hypothetical protein
LNVLRDIRTTLNFQNRLLQQLSISMGVPEAHVQFAYRGDGGGGDRRDRREREDRERGEVSRCESPKHSFEANE